jgi:Mg-chelatase subunit ChlD
MNKHLINHIVFVVDESGSMQLLSKDVVKVFDSQIQHLAQRSQELDQETRVSVYLFN